MNGADRYPRLAAFVACHARPAGSARDAGAIILSFDRRFGGLLLLALFAAALAGGRARPFWGPRSSGTS